MTHTMLAAMLATRGGPEEIVVGSAPTPEPAADEVIIAVEAAAITPSELGWEPTWVRADGTDRTPTIPSHEVAGSVVAAGPQASDVAIGSKVFGLTDFYRNGAAAEYVAARGHDLAEWPAALDPVAVATLPLSGLTAWQALFDHGHLLAGQRVLIHGAAGGVGTFAVQLARLQGAHVIAIASAEDATLLRELGADVTVDRTALTFADPASVDLVIDAIGGDVLERSWPLLAPDGLIVSVAPSSRAIADRDPRGRFFIVTPDRGVLGELVRLLELGELRVVVARVFPLDEAREAYEFALREHPRGKVVLQIRA